MPVLKNEVHERFAQAMAQGKLSKREALIEARQGDLRSHKTGRDIKPYKMSGMACELFKRQDVSVRISELKGDVGKYLGLELGRIQDRVVMKMEMTTKKLIDEADAIQSKAMKSKQYAAANAALVTKAKLAGLWIERSENTNANYAISDRPLSVDEFDAKYLN